MALLVNQDIIKLIQVVHITIINVFTHRFHPHPELSPLCDRMWDADKNRLIPGVHYKIDPQGKTRFHSRQDHAADPLFTWVDPEVFKRPTYKS